MNQFREWLSDNLRYILLIAGVLGVLVALFFGVRAVSVGLSRSAEEGGGRIRLTADPSTNGDGTVSVGTKAEEVLTLGVPTPAPKAGTESTDSKAAAADSGAASQTESAPAAQDGGTALPVIPDQAKASDTESAAEPVGEEANRDQDEDLDEPENGESTASQDEDLDDAGSDADGSYARATGQVNVRTGAGMDSEVMGSVSRGTLVTVLGKEGSWYHVVTEEFGEGYIGQSYIQEISDPSEELPDEPEYEEETDQQEERIGVIKSAVSLRSGPGFDYAVIGQLSGGSTVTAVENVRGWWHVYTDQGEGYVGQSYISVS